MSEHATAGDSTVLAGLQQAFNASDDDKVKHAICSAWERETNSWSTVIPFVDERIRAWTPQDAEPSLEQRVARLEKGMKQWEFAANTNLGIEEQSLTRIEHRLAALEQHPEPTAPDDPVCAREGCGHTRSVHGDRSLVCPRCDCNEFIPAPQPAPDLDPVRVEAAAKAVYEHFYPELGKDWDDLWPVTQKARIETASRIIRAYQNGGGA